MLDSVSRCCGCGAWKWRGRVCEVCSLIEHDGMLARWRERIAADAARDKWMMETVEGRQESLRR